MVPVSVRSIPARPVSAAARATVRSMRTIAACGVAAAIAAASGAAGPGGLARRDAAPWPAIAVPHPGVRNAHAMAYDAARGRVVLVGGADAERVRSDTWAWTGPSAGWTHVTSDGPGARTFPALTYDAARQTVVLFGGNRALFGDGRETDTFLADTWLLGDRTWRRADVAGPGPRAEAAIAYDAARRRVVLFGGYRRGPSGTERLGDTWEWDGARWEQVATTGPAPRNGSSMAWDERARRIVLAGGPPRLVPPETWSWDGAAWTVEAGPHPPPRFNAAMVYHSGLAALLRLGGWTGERRAADTWARLPSGWRDLGVSGPSPRNHTAMAHDVARDRTVLFGGHDGDHVFGDTWEFDGRAWTLAADRPKARRVDNGH